MSTASDPICRQCRVSMEVGYTVDRGHGGSQQPAKWTEGEPKMRKFLGIPYVASVPDRDLTSIATWRCPRCGLLESYAR